MGYIADLISSLAALVDDPSTPEGQKMALVRDIATAQSATGVGSSGGPSANVAVTALPVSYLADIAAIKANTAKISQFGFQLAEDSAGTVFFIKTDTATGASTNVNVVTGAPFTPIGQIELTDPITNPVTVEMNEYAATTTNAGQWATSDILERIRTVNTTTGAITGTFWYSAAGALLSTIPVIGVDVTDTDRSYVARLASVDAKTLPPGQALEALSSPVVLPATQITALTPPTNTGYSTSALQTTGNTALTSIEAKTPSLGQALGGASTPVVLPVAQVATLTPPSNTGYALDASVNTLLKPTSTLAAVTTVGAVTAITNALPVGTNSIGQVTANAGTNLNTSALALESGGKLASIDGKTPSLGQALEAGSTPVVLPLTQVTALTPPTNTGYALDTSVNSLLKPASTLAGVTALGSITNALPAGANSIGQVTANAGTNLNTSALALESGGNLASVNAKLPAVLGQALVTTSLAVALPLTQIATLAAPVQFATWPTAFTTDIASAAITASTTSASFTPTTGLSQIFQVAISAVTGTLVTYNLTIQETCGANIWYDVYVFSTITSATISNYFSPPIALAGRGYRYVETITGTTPSITRSTGRAQGSISVPFNPIPTRLGGALITSSDFFVGSRMIKKLSLRNGGASPLFLQFHNSLTALTTGVVPVCGEIYSIPAAGGVVIDSTTFGGSGQNYGANTRVALSTTQQTYTPVTVFTGISLSIEVNA